MNYEKYYQNEVFLEYARRKLRKDMTRAEKVFWFQVKNSALGYKFRRQFSIKRFIADFYCHRLQLIIEIDGFTHEDEARQKYDIWRQKKLEALGYVVVRYTDDEILCDLDAVMQHLLRTIALLQPRDLLLKSNPT